MEKAEWVNRKCSNLSEMKTVENKGQTGESDWERSANKQILIDLYVFNKMLPTSGSVTQALFSSLLSFQCLYILCYAATPQHTVEWWGAYKL